MKRPTPKSILPHSDSKITKDFKEWLARETFDELIEKAKSGDLTFEEKQIIVEEMSYFSCPIDEIATLMNTTAYYININFKDVLNRAIVRWRFDLRKAQVRNSQDGSGSTAMLIWLGKQYLSQKEDPQLDIKKEKFDEFIEWMRSQTPSTEYHQNSKTSSSTQMPETI